MDRIPGYLLIFYIQIKRHAEERGYLKKRLEKLDPVKATYEITMLHELRELHLIGLSEAETEVVFNPIVNHESPNHIVIGPRTETRVLVPDLFVILARGRYVWSELICDVALWLLASLTGSVIGVAISR